MRKLRPFSHQPLIPPAAVRTGAGLTCSNVLIACSLFIPPAHVPATGGSLVPSVVRLRVSRFGETAFAFLRGLPSRSTRALSCARRLAGQEGLEPPAPGFGDRCSTN